MGSSPILATKPVTNVAGFFISAMSTGFICASGAQGFKWRKKRGEGD
jgi:hypothetical protein